MPADAAARVLARVAASAAGDALPLVVFGLLQHECKLSVQVRCGGGHNSVWRARVAAAAALLPLTTLRLPPGTRRTVACAGRRWAVRSRWPAAGRRASLLVYSLGPASLQHYGVRKAASYEEPLANKEPLLLVTGLRSFAARPVYSTDEHGADKHKMERFLHEGR